MLTVNNLSKSYGPTTVLQKVSFSLGPGEKAGLVGANGVGKTTLLKILAGREPQDSGRVTLPTSAMVAYLPQTIPDFQGRTIDELLQASVGDLQQMGQRMRSIENAMSDAAGEELARLLEEYGEISTVFQERGGYELDHRIEIVLEGLGIAHIERTRSVHSLSGGERARVNLAMLLLTDPDLLLLDEPTNHLDRSGLEWLETYLRQFGKSILAASHDRRFLNSLATQIYEIDEHSHEIERYPGNYDAYRSAKDARRKKWEADYEQQQEEISALRRTVKTGGRAVRATRTPRDRDKYIPNYKAERAQESVSRGVRAAEERLKRIMQDPVPKPPRPLKVTAGLTPLSIRSAIVAKATGVTKRYGSNCILNDLDLTLNRDSRVAIVGPNGSGKTTLLRILAGDEAPDEGEIAFAPRARAGYLPQESLFDDLGRTVLEAYREGLVGYQGDFTFDLLRYGLFREDDIGKTLRQLSVGQLRKVEIARLIASEPNLLILDEPTNYLSLDVLEAFEATVAEWPGPVIAASHDRWFIDHFKGDVLEISETGLSPV